MSITTSQVNEIDYIQSCFEAISELLIPEDDLHIVGRNNLASLLNYLFERLRKAEEGYDSLSLDKRDDKRDEINTIHSCLFAITDLINTSDGLHGVNRDNLAMLLGYFSDRLREATEGAV